MGDTVLINNSTYLGADVPSLHTALSVGDDFVGNPKVYSAANPIVLRYGDTPNWCSTTNTTTYTLGIYTATDFRFWIVQILNTATSMASTHATSAEFPFVVTRSCCRTSLRPWCGFAQITQACSCGTVTWKCMLIRD